MCGFVPSVRASLQTPHRDFLSDVLQPGGLLQTHLSARWGRKTLETPPHANLPNLSPRGVSSFKCKPCPWASGPCTDTTPLSKERLQKAELPASRRRAQGAATGLREQRHQERQGGKAALHIAIWSPAPTSNVTYSTSDGLLAAKWTPTKYQFMSTTLDNSLANSGDRGHSESIILSSNFYFQL